MIPTEKLVKAIIYRINSDIRTDCEIPDYEDFPEEFSKDINEVGRCYSCTAKQVVQWLNKYLETIKA